MSQNLFGMSHFWKHDFFWAHFWGVVFGVENELISGFLTDSWNPADFRVFAISGLFLGSEAISGLFLGSEAILGSIFDFGLIF